MWNSQRDLKRRVERFDMRYDVYTPTRSFRMAGELVLRTYTAPQFQSLVQRAENFEVLQTFDFAYLVDAPIEVGPATEDVVFVLRKC